MGYISFRGVTTTSLGIIVSKMPSHKKGAMRHTEYTIPGRDGSLHVDEGYEPFDLIAYVMLDNANAIARQTVNAWADGTGKLFTSDDTSKCYEASVLKAIEWTRDEVGGKFYDTAKIVFHCQPFMRETVETTQTITTATTLLNAGDMDARPLIQVNGSGDCSFTVNGNEITIEGVQSSVPVYIDSETGYVYAASGAKAMTGEIPILPIGTSTITPGTGITSLIITPRWRWV